MKKFFTLILFLLSAPVFAGVGGYSTEHWTTKEKTNPMTDQAGVTTAVISKDENAVLLVICSQDELFLRVITFDDYVRWGREAELTMYDPDPMKFRVDGGDIEEFGFRTVPQQPRFATLFEVQELLPSLKAGSELAIGFEGGLPMTDKTYVFTLKGSSEAITKAEIACGQESS